MAASSISKAHCATCDCKGNGVFKCEGCGQVFCRKHVIEHREILNHQLDEIVMEYDTLQQTIAENNDKIRQQHPLIEEIDKWEQESIEKIRQTANDARQQLNALIDSSTEPIFRNLHELAQQLRKAREDDDYVEVDLRAWMNKLEQLKSDVTTSSPKVRLYEDTSKVLINTISITQAKSLTSSEERFVEYLGSVRIKNDGRMILHSDLEQSPAFVRGKNEYSTGRHQIQVLITKTSADYVMSFNITSKTIPISQTLSNGKRIAYGWFTDDRINYPESHRQPKKGFKDFQGETTLELQIIIDCTHRKISYINQRTHNTGEMNVNTDLCPFPWQLEFYLFNFNDRVELLSSTEVS